MSDTLPNEVREVMARAMLGPEYPWDGLPDDPPGFDTIREETRNRYRQLATAALSALEAAGWKLVRIDDLKRAHEWLKMPSSFEEAWVAGKLLERMLTASNPKEKPDV